MIIKYCNLVFYNSCIEDYLEMVDLIEEKGYKPDSDTNSDITDEMNRLREGKFDKHRQFKICFDTESKTYSFTGESVEIRTFFNEVASQETKRDMKLLRNNL